MFMADLCYIPKSPACFRSHMKYTNYFNWSMHTAEQIWRKKRIFEFFKNKTSKSNMTVSNNSQYLALHLSMKLLVIYSAFSK